MSLYEDKTSANINGATSDSEALVGILYSYASDDNQIKDFEIVSLSILLYSKQKFVGIDIVPLQTKSFHFRAEENYENSFLIVVNGLNKQIKLNLIALVFQVSIAVRTL